jgi:hypothetical protein
LIEKDELDVRTPQLEVVMEDEEWRREGTG